MSALWRRYSDWIEARQDRERLVLAVAAVAVALTLGLGQWAVPVFGDAARLHSQAERDRALVRELAPQAEALARQAASPDAAAKARLAELQRRFDEQEPRIQALQQTLVPAKDMPAFLERLLAGNRGLGLVALDTLPPEAATGGEDKPGPRLYKHGVRLRLTGSYRELLAYLNDLEHSSRQVLWGELKIAAEDYPRVEMTLTVYTLSLDKAWMAL